MWASEANGWPNLTETILVRHGAQMTLPSFMIDTGWTFG